MKEMKAMKRKSEMVANEMPMYKPRVHFDESQLKEIKDWLPGKTYKVEMKLKQMDKHINEMNKVSASFEVVGVKAESYK